MPEVCGTYETYVKRNDRVIRRWQANDDLDAATQVRFIVKNSDGVLIDRNISSGNIDGEIVSVELQTEETADAGEWNVEIEATFPDGQVITYPDNGYLKLYIVEDLA